MHKLKPELKLWLSMKGADGAFGDGKWRLLKAIDQQGSLKAAAAILEISYRKAWGDIKKAEESLKIDLVSRLHGGKEKGSMHLTDEGRCIMEKYTDYRLEVENTVKAAYSKHLGDLL